MPPINASQRGDPVAAETARTVPVQSSKYATPSETTGVPVTPTSPSIDQRLRSDRTVPAVTSGSPAPSRVFARSWPYTGQSSRVPDSANEPRGAVVEVGTARPGPEPELHAPASSAQLTIGAATENARIPATMARSTRSAPRPQG